MTKLKIAIAGAGGIGGYVTQFLYEYGLNRRQFDFADMDITVFDDDAVDASNLLHQNFTEAELGFKKAKILADKYYMNHKLVKMTVEDMSKYDVIFSCVDNMPFRKLLYEYGYTNKKLFWIDGRCNSRNIGLFTSDIGKAELSKVINDSQESTGCLLKHDKESGTSHVTPLIVAGMMVQAFMNHIRKQTTGSVKLYV